MDPDQIDWTTLDSASYATVSSDILDKSHALLVATNDGLAGPESLKQTALPLIEAVLSGRFEPIQDRILNQNTLALDAGLGDAINSYRGHTALQDFFPEGSEDWTAEKSFAFLWNASERRQFHLNAVDANSIEVGHAKTVDLKNDWDESGGTAKFTHIVRADEGRFTNEEVASLKPSEVAYIQIRVRNVAGHHNRLRFVFFYDQSHELWLPAMLACEVPRGTPRPLLLF